MMTGTHITEPFQILYPLFSYNITQITHTYSALSSANLMGINSNADKPEDIQYAFSII